MTPNQLRVFAAVASLGSVRAAAERLFVTQPAVSAAVAALQTELGVPLVARDGRGLRLTPAGEVFAGYARKILGLLEEAAVAATGQLAPERGRVRIAAVTTAGEQVLPAFLAGFREQYPDAELAVEVGNRGRVWNLLHDRQVDVAIGGRPPAESDLTTLATRPHQLVVVTAPAATQAHPQGLGGQVWLLREQGSGTRAATEELLGELAITPPTLTIGSNVAIRETLVAGLGVAQLSSDAVERDLEAGRLCLWPGEHLARDRAWCVVGRADQDLPATAGLFVRHLCDPGPALLPRPFHLTGDGTSPARS